MLWCGDVVVIVVAGCESGGVKKRAVCWKRMVRANVAVAVKSRSVLKLLAAVLCRGEREGRSGPR
jgi:hypothetical protein